VDLSDEALIESFRQTKDPTLFKSLIRRYQNRIYNAAYRVLGNAEEAEEVVQDTCVKVHQNLPKFRSQSSFAAWLFAIVHNNCLDIMRTKLRRQSGFRFLQFDPQSTAESEGEVDSQVVSQAADASPNPAEMLDMEEQGTVIAESLRQLPANQRVVVVLHDIEGFSYQEIAQIVGASLGTVRSRLHYGRLRLKEILEPYFAARNHNTPAPTPR